ncbi:hypothetical protein CHS0354_016328 [Potamilus streckersoni]|uniref:Uncharacterized protein n=1 Tax=Potamilus streckersoni TaxID=2493646 RepID=A0AAE0S7H7_9BIVA|nr:hypothetical protein CHS0354_016328 [Potamilus streckersoni]
MERKRKASFADKTKPLSQHDRLHPETIKHKWQSFGTRETKHTIMATEHNEKARPFSTRATTYLRILSTSVINVNLEGTRTKPYSDSYHDKQEALYNTNLII